MDLTALQRTVDGTVVAADAPGYEAVRREMSWNQLCPARRPAAIVRVASEADVVAAVRFARAHGVKVAVRGGGHNWWGAPLREGALLLDLARLNQVSVDAGTATAAVQPAVTGRELHRHLAPHGLAFPSGHCSTVALSGFLLSGGFGVNSGAWGPACLNVRAVDVVTAGGELVRADATQHADLFWAARGAGLGFCAVVTRFHLALHRLPAAMQTSTYVYPLERLAELGGWQSDLAAELASDVELLLLACPGGSTPLRTARRVCVLSATAFVDDENDAADLLAPLDRAPLPSETLMVERTRPASFDTLFDEMDRQFPARHRYLAEALWSDDAAQSVLAGVQPLIAQPPSPKSRLLCVMPPAPPPGAPVPDIAFSVSARLFLGCYAIWDDPAGDALNRAWHDDATAALERSAVGHYIGESDIAAVPARAPRAFSAAAWTRLRTVRQQYDPDGVFFDFP